MQKMAYGITLVFLLQYFSADIIFAGSPPALPKISLENSNNNSKSSWVDSVINIFSFSKAKKSADKVTLPDPKEALPIQNNNNIKDQNAGNEIINIQNEITNIDQTLSKNSHKVSNVNSTNIISDNTSQSKNNQDVAIPDNILEKPTDNIQAQSTKLDSSNTVKSYIQAPMPDTNNLSSQNITPIKPQTIIPINSSLDTNKTNNQTTLISQNTESKSSSIFDVQTIPTKPKITAKTQEYSQEKIDFINNELIMLQIPDEDFVCGKMTNQAKLNEMSFDKYVKLFWENFETKNQKITKADINQYVADHDKMFLEPKSNSKIIYIRDKTKELALDYLANGKFDELKVMIDNYPILNNKYEGGNNLLHISSYLNKEIFARYLLAKGINQFSMNNKNMTAYDIANLLQNFDLVRLLLNSKITKHLYY